MSSTNAQQNVVFILEKIYIKDASYEAPGSPQVFLQQETPEVNITIGLQHARLDQEQGLYEVVLTVTTQARQQDKVLFLIEVQQAGLFRITGLNGEALERTLEISCPYVLLPFLRETVAEFVTKGGFPPLLINPVNFDALYEQKRQAQQVQQAKGEA